MYNQNDATCNILRAYSLITTFIICSYILVENILSYGIIKLPLDIVWDFIIFLMESDFLTVVFYIILGFFIKITSICVIEMLLNKNYLTNGFGLTLHFISIFLMITVLNYCFFQYNINRAAAFFIMVYISILLMKTWSFIYETLLARNQLRKEERLLRAALGLHFRLSRASLLFLRKERVIYDTPRMLLKFLFTTGRLYYRKEVIIERKQPRRFCKALNLLMLLFITSICTAFIYYQCISPRCNELIYALQENDYLKVALNFVRILFPLLFELYLLFYVQILSLYLPMTSYFGGSLPPQFNNEAEWWNANNAQWFSYKINILYYKFCTNYVYKPIKKYFEDECIGYVTVAFIYGVFGEILLTLPFRCMYGTCIMISLIYPTFAYMAGSMNIIKPEIKEAFVLIAGPVIFTWYFIYLYKVSVIDSFE